MIATTLDQLLTSQLDTARTRLQQWQNRIEHFKTMYIWETHKSYISVLSYIESEKSLIKELEKAIDILFTNKEA